MKSENMIREIENRKESVVKIAEKLKQHNIGDYYWNEIIELSKKDYFFETYMVVNWIGNKFKPKRILEIGTRAGGSLIALLSAYTPSEDSDIYCFDMWNAYHDTANIKNKYIKYAIRFFVPSFIKKYLAIKKVKVNLGLFQIPTNTLHFISGDSKKTVPDFLKNNPDKKFDFVLVDGGHDKLTASTDLNNVVSCVASGGILVFDDIGPGGWNLIDVWNDFKNKNTDKFDFYENLHRKGVGWAIKK